MQDKTIQEPVVTETEKEENKISSFEENIKDIIIAKTSYNPIWQSLYELNNKQYIISIINKRIETINEAKDPLFITSPDIYYYILEKSHNEWLIAKSDSIYNEEFEYLNFYNNFEIIKVNNQPYVYYQYRISPMGNAINYESVSFNLLSLNNYENYSTTYGGLTFLPYNETEYYLKEYNSSNSENLKKKKELKSFLDEKLKLCSIVALGIERGEDIEHPDNYAEKWNSDNQNIINNEINGETALNITYYDSPLFPIDELNDKDYLENNEFIIYAEFTGNVLGYNKTTGKFLPIWIDSCMRGCHKNITFEPGDSETYLCIENSMIKEQACIRINLSKMAFSYVEK